MDLTPQDVRDIVRLLDSAGLDEFSLDVGDYSVEVRRAGSAGWTAEQQLRREPVVVDAAETAADAAGAVPVTETELVAVPDGLVAVRPPLLGTFYRAPQPGAAAFVVEGDRVEPDTVVGIVETMKMMTPVAAGARGTVREFRAGDGEFVEADSVLVLLEPAP